ncbi:HNH endonuclease signature motif containing protein [Microbacterium aureliae]
MDIEHHDDSDDRRRPPDSPDPPPPDEMDRVLEIATMRAVMFAEQLMAIEQLRATRIAEAGAAGRAITDVLDRSLRLELVAGMGLTEYAAQELMSLTQSLLHRHRTVFDSLSRAIITEQHARTFVSLMDGIEPDIAQSLESEALRLAESHPLGAFRRLLRKLIDGARAHTLAERQQRALIARRVYIEHDGDGMSWTHHYGPTVEAHAAFDRATRMAKQIMSAPGETRTIDQVRADVLSDLMIDGDVPQHSAAVRGIRARVVVTVPALALLDDEHARRPDPPVVEGVGPIPIDAARELCGGARSWMRVLTHPETGMVLSVGRDAYEPPPSLKRLVKWRADRCLAPGCSMPASRCEVDHTLAWSAGGETAMWNLGPLCKNHHIVKTHGDWAVRQRAGGVLEWESPTGRVYAVQPERRVPVFTPRRDVEETPAPF